MGHQGADSRRRPQPRYGVVCMRREPCGPTRTDPRNIVITPPKPTSHPQHVRARVRTEIGARAMPGLSPSTHAMARSELVRANPGHILPGAPQSIVHCFFVNIKWVTTSRGSGLYPAPCPSTIKEPGADQGILSHKPRGSSLQWDTVISGNGALNSCWDRILKFRLNKENRRIASLSVGIPRR